MKVREGMVTEDGGVLDEQTGRPVSYKKHIRISRRDTFVNDLKNSTAQGILAFVLSLLTIPFLLYDIYVSYSYGGNAGYAVGIIPVLILAISVASIIIAGAGLKNRNKIRHDLERRAIVISAVIISLLLGLYVYGLVRVLKG